MTWGLYTRLAWRNILRNKRRTFIAGTAVAFGLAALMFVDALNLSMKENMIESATGSFLGQGQIFRKGFRKSFEIEQTINDLPQVLDELKSDSRVTHFAPRVLAFGMLSSSSNTSAVQMIGVDPAQEKHISQVNERIVNGNYFAGDDPHDIVVGSGLAKLLEVGLGDRVVITAAQAHTGELAQEMFRISGIYFFDANEMDKGMAFIRIGQAQKMLNLGSQVNLIALDFQDRTLGQQRDNAFWADYSQHGNEALGWADLVPQLEKVFELSNIGRIIVMVILFGVVALGIVNTLFMSLYERMFEFGVMRAVGTRPVSMGTLIVFEAIAMTGIDYSGIEYQGITFTKALYPVWSIQQFTLYPLAFLVFASLIALYPAAYAARITPARAMRKSF